MTAPSPGLMLAARVLLALAAFYPARLPARSLVEAGAATVWRHLDSGREPGANWQAAAFDDERWAAGPAPLGCGDPGLGTTISWGTDPAHKPVTAWFRHAFDAPELRPGERLVIVLCADDGAVVHLNGRELGRVNLPAGPLRADTAALRALSDAEEGFYLRLPVPVDALRPGRNVLAVEVRPAGLSR